MSADRSPGPQLFRRAVACAPDRARQSARRGEMWIDAAVRPRRRHLARFVVRGKERQWLRLGRPVAVHGQLPATGREYIATTVWTSTTQAAAANVNRSPSVPTLTVVPGGYLPDNSSPASGFSRFRWIARLSGRAPYTGS